ALLFRHPACRTISLHLTGPGHSAPHAITNACCGVAVETFNKWKSGFRHHADASRYANDSAVSVRSSLNDLGSFGSSFDLVDTRSRRTDRRI
ncbi:hypothetical protein, partial [Rhodopirellula bahusiensis]|uniref:hypothetical protein n=1 Tax=Rhodopirellula bahusiensis TaxID=2014065 RepID=UPI003267E17F